MEEQDESTRETETMEETDNKTMDAVEVDKKAEQRVQEEERIEWERKEHVRFHREEQVRRKAEMQQMEQIEHAIMTQEWRRRTEAMQNMAIEDERRQVAKNVNHANFVKQQGVERRAAARLERIKDLEAAHDEQAKKDRDDADYLQYAHDQMEDFAMKGRTVVPMKLTLQKQAKRTMRLVVE